jgi:hypothetical protein
MPYADPERQRAAKRESARRRRAAPCRTAVEPSPVSMQDLMMAGRLLNRGKSPYETDEQYHAALRQLWQRFCRVVEPE